MYRAGVIVRESQSLVDGIVHGMKEPVEHARLMIPGTYCNRPAKAVEDWTLACARAEARAWRWVRDYEAGGGRRERALREAGR